jgi:antitoxin (DNA-binding transcriptional repressor) of toxin-antitoxin stability system
MMKAMDRDERLRFVTADEFASRCDELLDDLVQQGGEILLTRGGHTVARLLPVTERLHPYVGRSRTRITATPGDLLAPVGEDWEVDQDL